MDTTAFTNERSEIRVLDFVAVCSWKSESSISFKLGRYGTTLTFADREEPLHFGKNLDFNVFGWLDVHHPCDDHIKARIRAKLSPDLMQLEIHLAIIDVIFDSLRIPHDETYEADFFETEEQASIHLSVDRDGFTDRT